MLLADREQWIVRRAARRLAERREEAKMGHIYVVTVGCPGEEQGEFYKDEAYVSESVAMVVAVECMESHGGRERFKEWVRAHPDDARHVIHRWDSSRFSVWLERLDIVR